MLDLLTYAGSVENLPGGFNHGVDSGRLQFWYGDVRNASLVDTLVEQADVVVHFAAETHVTRSIYDNYHFFETDVLGTQVVANSVLKHVKHIDRFIHISTSEVYGTARAPKMDEDAPLMPLSPYASAKAGADRLVYSYFATYNLPAIIVRPFNQFGPRQHLEKVDSALHHQLPARRAAARARRRLGGARFHLRRRHLPRARLPGALPTRRGGRRGHQPRLRREHFAVGDGAARRAGR